MYAYLTGILGQIEQQSDKEAINFSLTLSFILVVATLVEHCLFLATFILTVLVFFLG
jgi:uncharacterized Tic20 family protein